MKEMKWNFKRTNCSRYPQSRDCHQKKNHAFLLEIMMRMGIVTKPVEVMNIKEKLEDKVTEVIYIFDDDIEITSGNIVKPGSSSHPTYHVLQRIS